MFVGGLHPQFMKVIVTKRPATKEEAQRKDRQVEAGRE